MKRLEGRVAATVLQSSFDVMLGGATWAVAPPLVCTIIKFSELCSRLPDYQMAESGSAILSEVIQKREGAETIADIVATLVCGWHEHFRLNPLTWLGYLRWRRRYRRVHRIALYHLSPSEVRTAIEQCLATLEVGDFFGLTTSLTRKNLLKETKTTAFGA